MAKSGMQKYCCEECQTKAKEARKKRQQENEVLDYISGEEVMSIYKVKKSWLYTSAKRNQVPVCRIAGKNYYSRMHMDKLFGKSVNVEAISEWLTMKEAEELYGMSAASVRSNAYRHHIPTKREYGQTYYSKDHFEQLRRTDLVADDSYYTAREAAEKYGMSTANVSIIAKKNSIVMIKVGVKNLIPKADFDKIMEERLAQYGSYHIF